MRRVRGAGCEVDEERFIRRQRFLVLDPVDRLVGHVRHQMIVRVMRRFDLGHPVIKQRRPLVGLAAEEAIKLVEAGAGRPTVGRSGRAHLPGRGFVRLAECRRAVAVEPQHLCNGCYAVGALPGLPGEARGGLCDRTHIVHVMVAAGKQRGPGRRTKCRGVKLVVAQPIVGEGFHSRHMDRPAKGARLTKTHVVDQHDQHIGRLGRGLDLEAGRRRRVPGVQHGAVRVLRLGDRQHGAIGRERDADSWLRLCNAGNASSQKNQRTCERGGDER